MVVLQSFREPRPTTNPYISQLLTALRATATVETFDWRVALLGRWDVLHVHWPEVVFRRGSRAKTVAGAALFALLLVRVRVTRRALVRTAHNLRPHEETDRLSRAVLRLCDRWTTLWVRLNPETETPPGSPVRTILHGHYRDWFAAEPRRPVVPGRVLFFGQVRPYKGIPELLAAFAGVDDPGLSLRIVGTPHSAAFAAELVERASDSRVALRLEFVDDAELSAEVSAAELVVLPYQEMHNSGALLLALSLDRPVLVPDTPVTAALAAEVGAGWVHRYPTELTADSIGSAAAAAATARAGRDLAGPDLAGPDLAGPELAGPDLTGRAWGLVAAEHLAAYREAVRVARQASRRYSE